MESHSHGGCPHHQRPTSYSDVDNDDEKEKKKKFLLHLIEPVLKYHVSPGKKSIKDIVESSTLASALKIS